MAESLVTVDGFLTEEEAWRTAGGMRERREKTVHCTENGAHDAHVVNVTGRYYACGGQR
jgi:hypothetical protein